MKPLKYFFHPTTLCRMRTCILSSQYRYSSTDKATNTKMETNGTPETKPEIGPEAPELQINNLTGDHERTKDFYYFPLKVLFF